MSNDQRYWEFTGETMQWFGRTLRQIRRVVDGEVGGWIEEEENLPHDKSWVSAESKVMDGSTVRDGSTVSRSTVRDGSTVMDGSTVSRSTVRDGSTVMNGSTVSRSTVMDGSTVSRSTVRDGKIGKDTKIIGISGLRWSITVIGGDQPTYAQIGCERVTGFTDEIRDAVAEKNDTSPADAAAIQAMVLAAVAVIEAKKEASDGPES